MDSWIVGQISFWYTVNKVEPAKIVDKAIEIVLDLVTPGRGAGESNWWMRGVRAVEQNMDRTSREMDIRSELRSWDRDYPEIHHELIVRWVSGAVVSLFAVMIYDGLKPSSGKGRSKR